MSSLNELMDDKSESFLQHVHPDLIKVMRGALQTPPFVIVYGVRTLAAEKEAVATGHSTTLRSRHLPDSHYSGLALAVDVAALVDGEPFWAPGHEAVVFGAIARSIKLSAEHLGVPIEWGGDWHSFKDWGHFQLPWAKYP